MFLKFRNFFKSLDTLKIVGFFLVFVIGILVFYYSYWIKRPIYSLHLIHQAVMKKDVVTFERHFDSKSVYTNFFDEAVGYALHDDKGKSDAGVFGKVLASGLIHSLKPTIISNYKELTLKFVKDDLPLVNSSDDYGIYTSMIDALRSLRQSLLHSNLRLYDYNYLSDNDDSCVLQLLFLNKAKASKFSVNVELQRLYDGKWKVVKIHDFKDVLSSVDVSNSAIVSKSLSKPVNNSSLSSKKSVTVNDSLSFKVSLSRRKEVSDIVRKFLLKADKVDYLSVSGGSKSITTYSFRKKLFKSLGSSDYSNLHFNAYFIVSEDSSITCDITFFVGGSNHRDWNKIVFFKGDKALSSLSFDTVSSTSSKKPELKNYDSFTTLSCSLFGYHDLFHSLDVGVDSLCFFSNNGNLIYNFSMDSDFYSFFSELLMIENLVHDNLRRDDGEYFLF